MTYMLHAHLHLPEQCYKFGPLHRLSSFPFEGLFKICKSYVHGTRGYSNQLYTNFTTNQQLSLLIDDVCYGMQDIRLQSFLCHKIIKKTNSNRFYAPFKTVCIDKLDSVKKDILLRNGCDVNGKICLFKKLFIKGLGLYPKISFYS